MAIELARRTFLRWTGDLALLALVPGEALAAAVDAARAHAGDGVFLDAARLRTLRALCARFVPGPPEDPDPGALEAGAPEYIDLLLGAFERTPHPIFAGGPFSNREGGGRNAFAEFLALDALEERIWRTRIEGSRGRPEREWNGPVEGWQEIYQRGLVALDARAHWLHGRPFHALSSGAADTLVARAPASLGPFLELAYRHTMEGTYGAPEYGGNRDLVGWRYTRWPGDRQPHAYTLREISEPDADQAEAVARARTNAAAFTGSRS